MPNKTSSSLFNVVRMTIAVATLLLLIGATIAASQSPDSAATTKTSFDKLPSAIKQAATSNAPNVTFSEVHVIKESGNVVYSLIGSNEKGREVVLELSNTGKLQSLDQEIELQEVPPQIKQQLNLWLPIFVPDWARINKEGKDIHYLFGGKDKQGKTIDVRMSSDGKYMYVKSEGS